jgi:NAD(P)-dependent dehydrogenase (short-subunit alcohol dehydrogenase family)
MWDGTLRECDVDRLDRATLPDVRPSMHQIADRTVLITGAARGIGAATAARLHERGANVVLVGLEPGRLTDLAERLGDRALVCPADVTDAEALQDAVAVAVERFGGIDVAIANAGVHWSGTVDSSPLERIEREIEINLLGVVRTAHAVLPQLIKRRGYLLNIASLAAASHVPMMSAYAASKAGVEAFSDSIRVELRGSGVGVGCAYFGIIETDMVRDAYANPAVDRAKRMLPRFAARPAPLERAVDAVEAGVRARKARIWAPRYVGPMLLLRGVLQPLSELRASRGQGLGEALALARAQDDESRPALAGDRRELRERDPVR